MKHTIITEVETSDRNIVLFIEDGALVGINYWFGLGDPIGTAVTDWFLKPDPILFDHVRRFYNNAEYDIEFFFPSPCFDEQIQRLDKIMGAMHEVFFIEEQIKELQLKIKNLMENL